MSNIHGISIITSSGGDSAVLVTEVSFVELIEIMMVLVVILETVLLVEVQLVVVFVLDSLTVSCAQSVSFYFSLWPVPLQNSFFLHL